MNFLKRPSFYILTGIALIAVLFFVIAKQGIEFSQIRAAIGQFPITAIALAFLSVSGQIFFQIWRLWVLLPPGSELGWFDMSRAFVYGQVVNTFAPARAGDALKAVAMSKASPRLSIANAAGVLVADKAVDVLCIVVLCLWAGTSLLSQITEVPTPAPGLILAIVGVAVASGAALLRFAPQWFSRLKAIGAQFLNGLVSLKSPFRVGLALAFSVSCWLSECYGIKFLAAGQNFPLTLTDAIWVLLVLNVGIAVPVSVANVGAFEAAMVFGLSRFQIPAVQAIAIATVHHAIQMITIVMWGGIFWLEGRFQRRTAKNRQFKVTPQDKTNAVNYYQKISGDYHGTVEKGILKTARDRERNAVLRLAAFSPDTTDKWMADVGCGHGFYALEAKKKGLKVCAIDISPGMLEKLSQHVDETKVADVETLELPRTFDRVICAGVLDFVLEPEKVFKNLGKLVAPGGKLVVLAPRSGPGGLFYRFEKMCFGFRVNLYTPSWFERMAEACGLVPVEFTFPLPTNMAVSFERPKTSHAP